MYTDPNHIKISDPGQVEGNVVFEYLDSFGRDKEKVMEMKEHYKKGGLADKIIKEVLIDDLLHLIRPIRDRREALSDRVVLDRLYTDTAKSREVVCHNLEIFKKYIHFLS